VNCDVYYSEMTYYVLGQGGQVLAEYDSLSASTPPKARYVYAGSQRIAMVDAQNRVYYYLNDHLGSAAVVIDSAGNVKDKYKYKPFGESAGTTVTLGQSYRYTGKPLDEEMDLDWYYYGARYYDPEIGRFLAIDPLHGKYPILSPYAYVANNPLIYLDPNGKDILNDQGNVISNANVFWGLVRFNMLLARVPHHLWWDIEMIDNEDTAS
jgi:RHS repeat-associated protein